MSHGDTRSRTVQSSLAISTHSHPTPGLVVFNHIIGPNPYKKHRIHTSFRACAITCIHISDTEGLGMVDWGAPATPSPGIDRNDGVTTREVSWRFLSFLLINLPGHHLHGLTIFQERPQRIYVARDPNRRPAMRIGTETQEEAEEEEDFIDIILLLSGLRPGFYHLFDGTGGTLNVAVFADQVHADEYISWVSQLSHFWRTRARRHEAVRAAFMWQQPGMPVTHQDNLWEVMRRIVFCSLNWGHHEYSYYPRELTQVGLDA